MAFKIKDLMINVLPSGPEAACVLGHTAIECRPTIAVCDALHPATCACTHCSVCSLQCTHGGCTVHPCTAACTQFCTCTGLTPIPCGVACSNCSVCTDQCTVTQPCANTCACSFVCSQRVVSKINVSPDCAEQPAPEASFTALSALKDQLKQQLDEVEKQHAAAAAGLLPQSVEEADMLAQKLQEALDELKVHRAELAKKPKPAGD